MRFVVWLKRLVSVSLTCEIRVVGLLSNDRHRSIAAFAPLEEVQRDGAPVEAQKQSKGCESLQ
jgi:hypothetical protein